VRVSSKAPRNGQDDPFCEDDMKIIPLNGGVFAQVDDADYILLRQYKWYAFKPCKIWYASRYNPKKRKCNITMHREIMKPPSTKEIDHIDGNGLNNQRNNLRICTHQQNAWNQGVKLGNTTGFKGVKFDRSRGKYEAEIRIQGRKKFLGRFSSPTEAAQAYDRMDIKIHGEFANKQSLNKIYG
jgi:hypothetical protein